MSAPIELTGQIFFDLCVINKNPHKTIHGAVLWDCACVCGNVVIHTASNLKSGTVKSCGCKFKKLMREAIATHGLSRTPVHSIWKSIKQRTLNHNNLDYPRYGGRGITICDHWKNSFENFNTDMGPRPSNKHSVERRNNNGNYDPGNCYWGTHDEQANNKSSSIKYSFNGLNLTAAQIASKVDVNYEALRRRLIKDKNIEAVVLSIKRDQLNRKNHLNRRLWR